MNKTLKSKLKVEPFLVGLSFQDKSVNDEENVFFKFYFFSVILRKIT